jgi:hypothetical protein
MKFFQSKTHKMKKLFESKGEVKSSNAEEPDLAGYYNYADYLQWTFDGMVELINGKIFKMSPAPSSSGGTTWPWTIPSSSGPRWTSQAGNLAGTPSQT